MEYTLYIGYSMSHFDVFFSNAWTLWLNNVLCETGFNYFGAVHFQSIFVVSRHAHATKTHIHIVKHNGHLVNVLLYFFKFNFKVTILRILRLPELRYNYNRFWRSWFVPTYRALGLTDWPFVKFQLWKTLGINGYRCLKALWDDCYCFWWSRTVPTPRTANNPGLAVRQVCTLKYGGNQRIPS